MYLRILFVVFMLNETCKAAECITRGRFPNNMNPECRGYTMCLSGADSFTKHDILCPEHSVYSHLDNQCTNVTSYQCLPHHNCTQDGVYANTQSEDCTSYIACVKDLNNIISARIVYCPSNEVFSETEGTCVNETLFKCKIATEIPKVLQVSIDHVLENSGNSSVNSAMYISRISFYVTIISLIAFVINV